MLRKCSKSPVIADPFELAEFMTVAARLWWYVKPRLCSALLLVLPKWNDTRLNMVMVLLLRDVYCRSACLLLITSGLTRSIRRV